MINIKESFMMSGNANNFTLNLCAFLHLEVNNPESSQKLSVGFASARKVIDWRESWRGSMRWFDFINSIVIVCGK